MAWGKILTGTVLGVGAVAAAPFTGGGSILAATTLAGSLAGASTAAAAVGAGVVGAATGAVLSSEEKKHNEKIEKTLVKNQKETEKYEKILAEHEVHTNYILALSAIGIAMANADGEISDEEMLDLNHYVGGLSSENYPKLIVEQIEKWVEEPPTFNEALKHLEKVQDIIKYDEIRNIMVVVMEADGYANKYEKAFLAAFDEKVHELRSIK